MASYSYAPAVCEAKFPYTAVRIKVKRFSDIMISHHASCAMRTAAQGYATRAAGAVRD